MKYFHYHHENPNQGESRSRKIFLNSWWDFIAFLPSSCEMTSRRRWKFCTFLNLSIFYMKLGGFVLASASRVWCHSHVGTNVLLKAVPASKSAQFVSLLRLWCLWTVSSVLRGMKRLLWIMEKFVEKAQLAASKRNLKIWPIRHNWLVPS